ncbi:MAG: 3-hydroxyacyl-CoA dehydrogenase/enoyl-CoA hydratase family protein [Acidobacteriota bacterium]
MVRNMEKAAVLGAGVMGAQIAAHLANAGIPVVLLDIVPPDTPAEADAVARSRLARSAIEKMHTIKPAPFFLASHAGRIRVGNVEDHLVWLRDADWIIEAVAENLAIKRALYEKIEPFRKPGSLITSNTSGIPIASLAEGRSEDFRRNFLGTHFFNPPRYMYLVELIRTPDTDPEAVCFASKLCDELLGKGIVYANDRPNFIANRIGIYGFMRTIQAMMEMGLSITEVDKMTGPAIGRPNSATFRTGDLSGLDTTVAVAQTVYETIPEDECRELFVPPDFIRQMVARHWVGDKAGQGFYKRVQTEVGREIYELDYRKMEYRPQPKVNFPSLEEAKRIGDSRERLRFLINGKDVVGQFLWSVIGDALVYTANRIPEITDDLVQVDRAMKWGYNWQLGPFETWDALGVTEIVKRLEADGKSIPHLVTELLSTGKTSFYSTHEAQTVVFVPAKKTHEPVGERVGVIVLKSVKERIGVIKKNAGASLIDLGDGVACLEFHTKMNALGTDTIQMIQFAIKEVAQNFVGLVVGNQGENFSAGANLMLMLMGAQEGEWDELDQAIRTFQNTVMSLRYSPKPTVVTPFGLTLGGGCEITMHGDRVRAAAESYIGLVEVGVGLLPAGGGTKEMLVRCADRVRGTEADLMVFVKEVFQNIMLAKTSTSAEEARELGYLRPTDGITMNRDRLIADAKHAVLALAQEGYRQPMMRTDIPALGESGLAVLKLGLHQMLRAGYATEHDVVIGTKVAKVLTGGDLNHPSTVSEQDLLDLEREGFLSLLGERKTQERIQHTLKTGKPLRN